MKRCVIVAGGERAPIGPLREGDFLLACDSGLVYALDEGLRPDLILGDFDSYTGELPPGIPVLRYPVVKDDTDTMFAVKEGLRRGFEDFLLIGALGGRLDHTMVNVYSLLYLDEKGKNGAIADDFSVVRLVSRTPAEIGPEWTFFSLVNIDGSAHGVTIRDAKYELTDAEIPCSFQYATSNEPLPNQKATVSLKEGRLLLICDYE